jgi:superfamily II DNA or RNA helicase
MIKFEIINDSKQLKISEYSLNVERDYIYSFFKKKSKDADFNSAVENGTWDGMDHFMTKDGIIPIGLWREVSEFSKIYNIPTEIDGIKSVLDLKLNRHNYEKFVNALYKGILTDKGEPFYPRDYQYEGAFRALKYRFCCEELATSSGKTSIFYTYNSYLKYVGVINKNNKALLIVPNVSLVNQTAKAFEQYSNGLVKWNIHTVGGKKGEFDHKKFEECDMIITTYQSMLNLVPRCLENRLENLIMKPIKKGEEEKRQSDIMNIKRKLAESKILDMCSDFSVVCVDEAHKARGNSIGDILESCINWKYKLGLSGTMKIDLEYSDFFTMQQRTGPLVMTLSAKFLIDNDYSPDIKIKPVFLEYDITNPAISEYIKIQSDKELRKKVKDQFRDPKEFGKRMLEIEKEIIFDSNERIEFINRLIKKFGKNTLILFSDVKNEYGLRFYDIIKEWNPNTFYIDGSVDTIDREIAKDSMEANNDVIIVASYGTFATGIDCKNVHHIIFVESMKAEITIRQAVGRGMRFLIGKNVVIIWDIIDDLSGYSVKHSDVRLDIYKSQEFEILNSKRVQLKDFKAE